MTSIEISLQQHTTNLNINRTNFHTPSKQLPHIQNPMTQEGLPMPQNKRIDVRHGSSDNQTSYGVFFVPVVGTALSENRYYAVKADGRRGKGEVYTSRSEETMVNCFGCRFCGSDEKPKPLDPTDTYQQVVLSYTPGCGNDYFSAKSVAEDGVLPSFLRTNPRGVRTHTPNFTLHEANGINASLRDCLPSISPDVPVVVGKWYCPFLFIKEGKPKKQMKKSMFYEVTLEQRWKMIFSHENEFKGTNSVSFDVVVPTHVPKIAGTVAVQDTNATDDGIVWLKCSATRIDEEAARVGLSGLVMERMIWEQERVGWVTNKEKQIRVAKAEEYGGVVPWMEFGCYVFVESFVFRRMDGIIALAYDFMHSHRIRVQWA